MANYNADVRIGITGKTQLNALERQLGRINKDLNKINKNLKAQTLTINTKGANRALDQLDRKINKLNRTVNVAVNEREGRRQGSGSSSVIVASGEGTKALAGGLAAAAAQQKILRKESEAVENSIDRANDLTEEFARKNKELQEIYRRQDQVRKGFAEKGKSLKQSERDLANSAKLRERAQRRRTAELARELRILQQQSAEQRKLERIENQRTKGLTFDQRLKARQKEVDKVKQGRKGAGAAAAFTATSIPGFSNTAAGALIGGGVGGPPGAIAGALIGAVADLGTAFVNTTADITKFNNELLKQQRALANTVATSDELEAALNAVDQASQDFLVPIGEATQQFTKLNAAARASGFTVQEVEEVYRGLAAANTALGGDSQKLQGILLATQQVFSKGKVQAEELRGQIGERLPGAFALFAQAINKTPAELDKALERGEVSLEDFVTFARSLLERYEDDAKTIADAPENAAARLKLAMDNLRKAMGPILTEIGNDFIELATVVVKQITRMFDAINNARAAQALGGQRQAQAGFAEASSNLRLAQEAFNNADDKSTGGAAYTRLRNATQGYEMATRALRQANQNVADTKLPFTATGKPAGNRPTPAPTNQTGGSGSSGGGSGPRDTTAELQAAIALQQTLLQIEKERFGLTERELELRSFDQQRLTVEAELKRELADIQQDNITAESKALASTLAKLEAETDLQQIKNEQQQYESAIAADIQQQITDLETQIAAEEAITDEMKEQVILAARIAEIQNGPGEEGDKQRLIDAERRLKKARDGNQGVSGYMKQLQRELGDTEAMIVSMAQTVETELASAMSTAIIGLLDGTATAEEAFATMFKNIGQAFIDMATQMIAKALIMKALGILLPGAGNASSAAPPAAPNGTQVFGGQLINTGMQLAADGGPAFTNRPMIVGERGPELFIPGGNGRIATNTESRAALDRYNTNNDSSYGTRLSITTGPVMQMNNDQYIKREDFERGLRQASADGAKQGEAMALRRLKNSRSTRAQLGM